MGALRVARCNAGGLEQGVEMKKYFVQRVMLAIPTVFFITVLTFVGLRVLLPVSAIDQIVGEYGKNDPELRRNIEEQLGLNGSVAKQYAIWMGEIVRGDFGSSLHSGRSVRGELKARIPVTLELGIVGLVAGLTWAIPLGVWSAVKQDHLLDYGARGLAILLSSVPSFWIAVLAITLGSIWFQYAPPIRYEDFWQDPVAHFKIMLLPCLIIALTPAGALIRLVRTTMLDVLRQDYVRTAHAKGLSNNTVLYRHALRNGLIPVITVVGAALPTLLAGTVIFERIFASPGMGVYLVEGITRLDYPVIQATNLIFAVLLVVAIILVDLSYAFLDPRIRFS